ncbi:MAG: hypothetical protein LBN74_02960 [Prevotella sp.]|jgi:hypothetical protein|nr:hypothetical protein [Prevotella sp.]
MKNYRGKRFLGVLIFLAVFAAAIAVVMLLWNALIPSIIGWSAINYWQAAGLLILSRLLLGGFGRFRKFGGHGHFGNKRRDDFHYWHVMRDKMKGMSREEKREYMRKHILEHHGFGEDFVDNRKTTEANGNTEE